MPDNACGYGITNINSTMAPDLDTCLMFCQLHNTHYCLYHGNSTNDTCIAKDRQSDCVYDHHELPGAVVYVKSSPAMLRYDFFTAGTTCEWTGIGTRLQFTYGLSGCIESCYEVNAFYCTYVGQACWSDPESNYDCSGGQQPLVGISNQYVFINNDPTATTPSPIPSPTPVPERNQTSPWKSLGFYVAASLCGFLLCVAAVAVVARWKLAPRVSPKRTRRRRHRHHKSKSLELQGDNELTVDGKYSSMTVNLPEDYELAEFE